MCVTFFCRTTVVLTSEVHDDAGEEQGEDGERQRHQAPAAVEAAPAAQQELLPIQNKKIYIHIKKQCTFNTVQ